MMAELFGRVDGYCKGKGGSMHIADFAVGMLGANGIVGGGLPIACGAALAAQLDGKGDVDGVLLRRRRGRRRASSTRRSTSRRCGSCPSSSSARTTSTRRTTPSACSIRGIDIAAHAAPYGMPGVIADGNDVLAVRAAAARGRGPRPARRGADACSSARPTAGTSTRCGTRRRRRRRPADEIASVEGARPDRALRGTSRSARACSSPAEIGAMRERVAADLAEAVAFAEASPFPDPKDLLVDMFAE